MKTKMIKIWHQNKVSLHKFGSLQEQYHDDVARKKILELHEVIPVRKLIADHAITSGADSLLATGMLPDIGEEDKIGFYKWHCYEVR